MTDVKGPSLLGQLLTDAFVKGVESHIRSYSKEQELFTRGTREASKEGWTGMTLEWGKADVNRQQMEPLERTLTDAFPEECAVFGALGLLKLVATKIPTLRVIERDADYTPTRGVNKGKARSAKVHDVYFTDPNRPRGRFNPFAKAPETAPAASTVVPPVE